MKGDFLMLKQKLEQIKARLNQEYKSIDTMKVYSNHVPVNIKIKKLSTLPSRLRGAASLVYDAMEAHCNKDFQVYATQQTIAKETGYSREWVNHIIQLLVDVGLIEKIRRGLKQPNLYTLIIKKKISSIINEIKFVLIEIARGKKKKQSEKNSYSQNKRTFTDYDQRSYDYDALEKVALGEMEIDDLSEIMIS
jgi:DNA-binding Lrp family transcriptional regulator